MRDVLKKVAPDLRAVGFRGSGQNYRKCEGDFVFVVNFQGSSTFDRFYVNLGAQPIFGRAELDANLKTLKEYECMLRRRVGSEWSWSMADERVAELRGALISTQREFFGHALTLPAALAIEPADVLIQQFSAGQTRASQSLRLAQAALALGHRDAARALAERGLELATGATILIADLEALLVSLQP